jgi:hypothetical protein
MPHAFDSEHQLPAGLTPKGVQSFLESHGFLDILAEFEKPLLEIFRGVMPLRIQQRKPRMTYSEFQTFAERFFHFQRDKPPLLSVKQLAMIFIACKKNGGTGSMPDDIGFAEFQVLLGVVAVAATTHMFQFTQFHKQSRSIQASEGEGDGEGDDGDSLLYKALYSKFGIDEESSMKWLLQRMYVVTLRYFEYSIIHAPPHLLLSDPWRTFAPTCAPTAASSADTFVCVMPCVFLPAHPLTTHSLVNLRSCPPSLPLPLSLFRSLFRSLLCRYNSAAVKNDKLRAGELFKHHFCDMWRTDGAPINYLAAEEEEDPDARYIVGMASLSPQTHKGRKQQRPSIAILNVDGKMG